MFVDTLSAASGIAPPVLRLLITLLGSYPLGWTYRVLFLKRSAALTSSDILTRHLFSIVTGIGICYFNYGNDTAHFLAAIVGSWLLLRLLGPTWLGMSSVFVYAFGYLLMGYHLYSTDDYDVNWTTSYCVTTLRLIGFGMDYADGCGKGKSKKTAVKQEASRKDGADSKAALLDEKVSADGKKSMASVGSTSVQTEVKSGATVAGKTSPISCWSNAELETLPSLLETLSYCFFFGGFLVGPQFPFRLYKRFVTLELFSNDNHASSSSKSVIPSGTGYAFRCFLLGVFYMALTQAGQALVPTAFVVSPMFTQWPWWKRMLYMAATGRIVLTKYLGVWLLNEGGCVLSGIAFNGYDPVYKRYKWDGLANIDPEMFETHTSFTHVVGSFNMNTNLWCKNYIFKRLRFLGNKTLSGLGALLFLAIWHGFAPGYFGAFLAEFMDMEAERMVVRWTSPYLNWMYDTSDKRYSTMLAGVGRMLNAVVSYTLIFFFLSYGTVTFDLLTWDKITLFWKNVWYFSYVAVFTVFVLNALMPSRRAAKEKKQ